MPQDRMAELNALIAAGKGDGEHSPMLSKIGITLTADEQTYGHGLSRACFYCGKRLWCKHREDRLAWREVNG